MVERLSDSGDEDVKTDMGLRAIPTEYDGVVYRSRNEARYAVFFKKLGIVNEWEPQGFHSRGGHCYLPDFLLAGQALIAEIKGSFDADPEGVEKWRGLVAARGKERGILCLPIIAGEMRFLLIGPDGRGGLWEDDQAQWYCCPQGYHFDVLTYPKGGCAECGAADGYWYDDPRIAAAFNCARSYRFGRGVTGG